MVSHPPTLGLIGIGAVGSIVNPFIQLALAAPESGRSCPLLASLLCDSIVADLSKRNASIGPEGRTIGWYFQSLQFQFRTSC